LLIAVNILIFLYEISLGNSLEIFIKNYGFIPANLSLTKTDFLPTVYPLISSIFLHGSWIHVLGNMWFLWIFGGAIEDRIGHFRFILFYLACGIAGSLTHAYLNPCSAIPTIGASGAISGILGAYFILYPFARVLTAVPIFIFFYFIKVPAFFFLGLWFLVQFFSGTSSILNEKNATEAVAWWAHVGGFTSGIIFIPIFLTGRKRQAKQND
jgi:membrane associated rhomboid family serine protease